MANRNSVLINSEIEKKLNLIDEKYSKRKSREIVCVELSVLNNGVEQVNI